MRFQFDLARMTVLYLQRIRYQKKTLFGALLVLITLAAIAKEYAFTIASAGPEFAGTTLEADRSAEFEAANKIASMYVQYRTPLAITRFYKDIVYVVYFDGQIAKFKMISAADSIRLRFESVVPAVPRTASRISASGGGSSGMLGGEGGVRWERTDFIERREGYGYQRERVGSVEVRQVESWADNSLCDRGCR